MTQTITAHFDGKVIVPDEPIQLPAGQALRVHLEPVEAPAPSTETVEERLRRLEATWLAEVGFSSSSTELRNHPAFQEIIALGDAVVPLMLRDLEQRPRLWVWALPRITGADPVPASDRGNIARMSEAWLRWAREHGYQW